jgi:hypothetical protein
LSSPKLKGPWGKDTLVSFSPLKEGGWLVLIHDGRDPEYWETGIMFDGCIAPEERRVFESEQEAVTDYMGRLSEVSVQQ